MSRSRRLIITMCALVTLLTTACGGDDAAPTEAPAEDTRVVEHAMGSTEIVGTPERVVVLDTGELDSVLALGVTPVGAVGADATSGLLSYLQDRTQGVEIVGTIPEPNLEAIAALQPDLILSSKLRHEDIYGQLTGIAPTVFAEKVGVAWKENFLLAGEALGKRADAERILDEYQQQAQRTGQAFGDPSQLEVSMVRFMPDGIRLYGKGSFIGTILEDAGFARPAPQQVNETFVEISREQLGLAEGDLLFYAGFGPEGAEQSATLTAGPLWQQIGAVSEGRAHAVPDDLWYLGIGPIAAGQVLDQLATYAPAS